MGRACGRVLSGPKGAQEPQVSKENPRVPAVPSPEGLHREVGHGPTCAAKSSFHQYLPSEWLLWPWRLFLLLLTVSPAWPGPCVSGAQGQGLRRGSKPVQFQTLPEWRCCFRSPGCRGAAGLRQGALSRSPARVPCLPGCPRPAPSRGLQPGLVTSAPLPGLCWVCPCSWGQTLLFPVVCGSVSLSRAFPLSWRTC